MEKLRMCRICLSLAQNTRMYVVVNKNLRDLYEKLTDVPFLTEDKRPILACFICCAKLKQCFRFVTKCLEAEEQFAQMMNEPNPLTNPDHLVSCSGLITTPIQNINIVDKCEIGSIAVKEPLPAVCQGLDDIIKIKEENLSDDLEPDVHNSYLDVEDMLPDHSVPDSESVDPLFEIKIEIEEAIEVPEEKLTAAVTNSARVTRKTKLEDTITAELIKKEPSNLKVSRTTRNHWKTKPGTSYKKPDECDQRILKKTYDCKVCQRSFSKKGYLTRHIRIHNGETTYTCDICQRGFIESDALRNHIRIHTGEKLYKCDVCQRGFIESGALRNHIRTHTGERPFKCDVCPRSFSQKNSLTEHFRIHTGEKPYKCEICQCSFRQSNQLTKHIRIHTGEKPYKCAVCQRSFNLKSSLTQHIRLHTGERPFKCDVCQRGFIAKGRLRYHYIRKHNTEKPYTCDICQRSFSTKGHLTSHIRIHNGEKPYTCDICQRSFSRKSSLKRHNILIHSDENSASLSTV